MDLSWWLDMESPLYNIIASFPPSAPLILCSFDVCLYPGRQWCPLSQTPFCWVNSGYSSSFLPRWIFCSWYLRLHVAKKAKFTHLYIFGLFSKRFFVVFSYFVCAQFSKRNFGCTKDLTFRKSGHILSKNLILTSNPLAASLFQKKVWKIILC